MVAEQVKTKKTKREAQPLEASLISHILVGSIYLLGTFA